MLRKVSSAICSSSTGDTADVAEETTRQLTGGLLANQFNALPQGSCGDACSVAVGSHESAPAPDESIGSRWPSIH
jgi:hypothetical protein